MKCINCGKADLIRGTVPLAVTVAGVEFVSELPGQRCPSCGYSTVHGPAAVRFELLVAAEFVKRGLRSGASFKFMRKALGMKAAEIGEAFNVAPETVSRWESGQREVDWPEFMLLGFLVDDKLAGRTTTLSRLKALAEPAQEESHDPVSSSLMVVDRRSAAMPFGHAAGEARCCLCSATNSRLDGTLAHGAVGVTPRTTNACL